MTTIHPTGMITGRRRIQPAAQRARPQRVQAARPLAQQRRIKISITVNPDLIEAVDEEARARGTNRSRVIDEALASWRAAQRHQALVRQYTTPLTAAQQEEQAAWDAILDAAAADMLADAAGH